MDLISGAAGVITSGTWDGQEGVDFGAGTTGQKIEFTGLIGEGLNVMSGHAVAHADSRVTPNDLLSVGDYFVLRYHEVAAGQLKIVYRYSAGWRAAVTASQVVPTDGTIHSMQGIADPDNSDQRVYFDGILQASASFSDAFSWTGQGSNTILANHGNSSTDELEGIIRFAALWNRVLTEQEIQMLGAFPYAMIEPRGGKLGVSR